MMNIWLTAHSANVWHSSDLSQAAFYWWVPLGFLCSLLWLNTLAYLRLPEISRLMLNMQNIKLKSSLKPASLLTFCCGLCYGL